VLEVPGLPRSIRMVLEWSLRPSDRQRRRPKDDSLSLGIDWVQMPESAISAELSPTVGTTDLLMYLFIENDVTFGRPKQSCRLSGSIEASSILFRTARTLRRKESGLCQDSARSTHGLTWFLFFGFCSSLRSRSARSEQRLTPTSA
jgi:molybdopterin-biosynthesis enzyme MoeA-like protein